MKKTFSWFLVLLGLVLLQRVEAQAPKAERPQSTTAEQEQPVEDPLGRSTPHGTVVGLDHGCRTGEPRSRRRISGVRAQASRPAGVGQDNCGSFWTASCSRAWIASVTSRTEISTMGSPTVIVSVLSKARPAMSRCFWTVCSEVKATPFGCSPPARCRRSPGSMMKSSRRGSNGICRSGSEPFDGCPYHSIDGSPSFLSSPWSSVSPRCPPAL